MRAPASAQDGERRLGIWLAFAFGCVFVAAVLVLAFQGQSLDDRRFEILRIVLALAGGGVGGVIPGFLDLNMKAGTRWALGAGGGLAVFIVLYFWSPAHWVTPQPSTVHQHTTGANSPAINGNGNTVSGGGPVR
jgi:peptidoglycan/LPS O-acetylase OafA/YrhL